MQHVNVRALLVSIGVRNRLQYLIVYKSKRIFVCVSSVRDVYHVTTNINNNISKKQANTF